VEGLETFFLDRGDAGRRLAAQLGAYANRSDVVVLGIPRGGVSVAYEIAMALGAPLDIFVSRKLGVPWQEELAFGAVAGGGVRILDPDIVGEVGISSDEIDRITASVLTEVERRERAYRGDRPRPDLEGKTVILVDDGIATGSSIRAAIGALRQWKPTKIVVATPVGPGATCNRLRNDGVEVVALMTPKSFAAIGQFYEDFSQVSDEEVIDLLSRAENARRMRQ
jgi:putative phosphoribosyl transferase